MLGYPRRSTPSAAEAVAATLTKLQAPDRAATVAKARDTGLGTQPRQHEGDVPVMHLQTERLLVRDLKSADLNTVHAILDVDLRIDDRSRQERGRWLDWAMLEYEQRQRAHQPPYGDYAVELTQTGEVVGLPHAMLPSPSRALRATRPYGAGRCPDAYDPSVEFDRFSVVLLMLRDDAPQLDAAAAAALQDAHMAHLAGLHESGYLLAAGPLIDERLRGLSILNVEPDEARRLQEQDPAVRAGTFSLHVMPWIVPAGAMSFSPTRFPHSVVEAEAGAD